jgi:ribosome-associated translation inhibitor RaiA
MSPEEKQISFYNRYFIFRKNRNINAKQLKNSFLSYAGLQEEQQRASSAMDVTDEAREQIALEKIAKASKPIDVASKPAIAARIIEERRDKAVEAEAGAGSGTVSATATATAASTLKIKPKPKKTTTVKATGTAAAEEKDAPSAPIEQIEKKIQKRTKKAKMADDAAAAAEPNKDAEAGAGAGAAAAPVKPKRQTKKKTDL